MEGSDKHSQSKEGLRETSSSSRVRNFKNLGKEIKWLDYTLAPCEWYFEKHPEKVKSVVAAVSDEYLPMSGTIVVEKINYKEFLIAILRREATGREKYEHLS
jgi:hypothetical protein